MSTVVLSPYVLRNETILCLYSRVKCPNMSLRCSRSVSSLAFSYHACPCCHAGPPGAHRAVMKELSSARVLSSDPGPGRGAGQACGREVATGKPRKASLSASRLGLPCSGQGCSGRANLGSSSRSATDIGQISGPI